MGSLLPFLEAGIAFFSDVGMQRKYPSGRSHRRAITSLAGKRALQESSRPFPNGLTGWWPDRGRFWPTFRALLTTHPLRHFSTAANEIALSTTIPDQRDRLRSFLHSGSVTAWHRRKSSYSTRMRVLSGPPGTYRSVGNVGRPEWNGRGGRTCVVAVASCWRTWTGSRRFTRARSLPPDLESAVLTPMNSAPSTLRGR